jgi:hypothetical protein
MLPSFASCFVGLLLAMSALQSVAVAQTPASNYMTFARTTVDDDNGYSPRIAKPAYDAEGPIVLLDQAHRNLPLTQGLVRLLSADGYRVMPARSAFTYDALSKAKVLVIMNPGVVRSRQPVDNPEPLFTEGEAAIIHDWVAGGGWLLFAADVSPLNAVTNDSSNVVRRFQVELSQDRVADPKFHDPSANPREPHGAVFSSENDTLSSHPILTGRSADEQVKKVVLSGMNAIQKAPENAVPLLRCSEKTFLVRRDALQVREVEEAARSAAPPGPGPEFKSSIAPSSAGPFPHAPVAIAFTLGKGRVVVVSNGMFLSAAVRTAVFDGKTSTSNIGLTEADNQQFALNIMHWLSGLIEDK